MRSEAQEKLIEAIAHAIIKLTSARLWVAIFATIASSYIVNEAAAALVLEGLTEAAVALVMAYLGYWGIIIKSYFDKSRPNENPLYKDGGKNV